MYLLSTLTFAVAARTPAPTPQLLPGAFDPAIIQLSDEELLERIRGHSLTRLGYPNLTGNRGDWIFRCDGSAVGNLGGGSPYRVEDGLVCVDIGLPAPDCSAILITDGVRAYVARPGLPTSNRDGWAVFELRPIGRGEGPRSPECRAARTTAQRSGR